MELILSELPETLRHYTGKPVPKWMRVLHPNAAASVLKLETELGPFIFTDLWRSAEVSALARAKKQGVQPPGYSAHNYGLSIDFSVEDCLKLKKVDYAHFTALLEGYDWHCHRRDGAPGKSEWWHFNFLGGDSKRLLALANKKSSTWALPVETKLQELYGPQMKLTAVEIQGRLKQLKMYSGDEDGRLGPISKQAILIFQKAWGLAPTGLADEKLQRTLAFVTATKKLVPPAL